ncbi:MAG TPA: biotin--[acetyl-CoA-carboxylase] ligase [Thermomicrobiales bacterium]|nr:biotin--[acetyl-CoA-carboxylase] ligase [Thermomicrobiales bacterium]
MQLGHPLIRRNEVASTMDEVRALALTGAPEGATVVAEYQHAGRGRADRRWVTPPGSALLMSVLLRPEHAAAELSPLSLLSALAVVDALEEGHQLDGVIKWPNDVQIAGRKICGILLRTHMVPGERWPVVVLGIGLNANIPADALPDNATSIALECGQEVDRDELRESILRHLERIYRRFLAGDLAGDWDRLSSLLAYRGQTVTVQDGERQMCGVIVGLSPSGSLLIREAEGAVVEIASGDLTRGPRPVK